MPSLRVSFVPEVKPVRCAVDKTMDTSASRRPTPSEAEATHELLADCSVLKTTTRNEILGFPARVGLSAVVPIACRAPQLRWAQSKSFLDSS